MIWNIRSTTMRSLRRPRFSMDIVRASPAAICPSSVVRAALPSYDCGLLVGAAVTTQGRQCSTNEGSIPTIMDAPAVYDNKRSISDVCDALCECYMKSQELEQQLKAQEKAEQAGTLAEGEEAAEQLLTRDGVEEFVGELKGTAVEEMSTLQNLLSDQAVTTAAATGDLRRSVFYVVALKQKDWTSDSMYHYTMRRLCLEFLRRDAEGTLSSEDTLFIITHVIIADYYNQQLWNRFEHQLGKHAAFDYIDIPTIKSLTKKLFRTRPKCRPESMDLRRRILLAMARRVGALCNEYDLPTVFGIVQCFTVHDIFPKPLETLTTRIVNSISDFSSQECATLCIMFRRWGLLKMEVCERLIERMAEADPLTPRMAAASLQAIKGSYRRVSDRTAGGTAEAQRQKLRALGEQIACRLDEVSFANLSSVLNCLDVTVSMKVYVPRKCLQNIFDHANVVVSQLQANQEGYADLEDTTVKPITAENARHLQALLHHYGVDLSPDLNQRIRQGLADGLFPDEYSL